MYAEQHEDEGYVSNSSIDSPPREEKEPEQTEMFESKEIVAGDKAEQELKSEAQEVHYKVDLSVTLTREGSKAIKIPLLDTTAPNWRVKELMLKSFNARRINAIIDAVLDVPEDSPKPENTTSAGVTLTLVGAAQDATCTVTDETLMDRNPLTGNILNGSTHTETEEIRDENF